MNIAPLEIDAVLLKHASIYDGAAVGVPDVVTGQGPLVSNWQDARLFAAAAGAAAYFWRKDVLVTIVVGMAVYLPLHIGWSW